MVPCEIATFLWPPPPRPQAPGRRCVGRRTPCRLCAGEREGRSRPFSDIGHSKERPVRIGALDIRMSAVRLRLMSRMAESPLGLWVGTTDDRKAGSSRWQTRSGDSTRLPVGCVFALLVHWRTSQGVEQSREANETGSDQKCGEHAECPIFYDEHHITPVSGHYFRQMALDARAHDQRGERLRSEHEYPDKHPCRRRYNGIVAFSTVRPRIRDV